MRNVLPALMLTACPKSADPVADAAGTDPTNPAAAEHSPNVDEAWRFEFTARMLEHEDRAKHARDHVVEGDLRGMREDVGWLADHSTSQAMPTVWVPFLDLMRRAAHETLTARTAPDAAMRMAALGQACGDCHAAMEKPLNPVAAPPAKKDDHATLSTWALDQMWAGLTYDNAASWNQGAAAMALAPMGPVGLQVTPETSARQNELAKQVHDIANSAAAIEYRGQQSEALGKILAACAECHLDARGL